VISPARLVAFDVLLLVEKNGYAADLLTSRAARLNSRDAGLASEIVLGSLRYQAQLDFLIQHLSGRSAAPLDPEVRVALRMGIYQLRHLDRVPAHAAVSDGVELAKRAHKRSAAGLVNAVLRKVNRNPIAWPDRSTELSHPAWLLQRWDQQFGSETATRIALANLATPQTYVRVPADSSPAPGLTLEATDVPGCFRLLQGAPSGLRIQDIGSQAVVPLLDLAPGQTFLDLCAAPGNKTAQALESGVRAVACDVHFSRLRLMKDLGCDLVVLDGAVPLPFASRFDRILVDAPCSGTGTLARNPEIKWRFQPSHLQQLHHLQVRLLANALERLAARARLVYSTCSLEREENEAVVEEALTATGIPARFRLWRRLPGIDAGDGFFAAVITSDEPLHDPNRSLDSVR
jgi:16S rRNA (cytosine967-C5)-methyltransferase